MGILIWTVIGLGVGGLANWTRPARDQRGFVLTFLMGLIGGVAGGLFGTIYGDGFVSVFSVESLLFATGGAVIVIAGFELSKVVFNLER